MQVRELPLTHVPFVPFHPILHLPLDHDDGESCLAGDFWLVVLERLLHKIKARPPLSLLLAAVIREATTILRYVPSHVGRSRIYYLALGFIVNASSMIGECLIIASAALCQCEHGHTEGGFSSRRLQVSLDSSQ